MAKDTIISNINVDNGADNGKVPVYNSTTKIFDMTTARLPAEFLLILTSIVVFNGSINTTIDVSISRNSAGNLALNSTTSGDALGTLALSQLVEANTAGSGSPNILLASESNKLLTNEGATAKNYHTLPSAAAGLQFYFVAPDADGMRITAATGDVIHVGSIASSSGGYIETTTQYASIILKAINSTDWVAFGVVETWTAA